MNEVRIFIERSTQSPRWLVTIGLYPAKATNCWYSLRGPAEGTGDTLAEAMREARRQWREWYQPWRETSEAAQ